MKQYCLALLCTCMAIVNALYPSYCAKDVAQHKIAPLAQTDIEKKYGNLTLLQVQIVIRHGARTPCFVPGCWDGYNLTWECDVRDYVFPEMREDRSRLIPHKIYEKIYQEGINSLRGNCHLGQLLDIGFEMELQNGRNFREAYIGNGSTNLFKPSDSIDFTNSSDFFLESDDEQRTIMSGQLVIDGMFPNANNITSHVPWYCGDLAETYYYPNSAVCPYLNKIESNWKHSDEYRRWKTSDENMELTQALKAALGHYNERNLFDCLMTSFCNDREMPSIFNATMIEKVMNYANQEISMNFNYNDSEYSKVGMARLYKMIRSRMSVRSKKSSSSPEGPRFVLYSGHDTTIMPLLASLGSDAWINAWVPYASFVAFELYSTSSGDHVVRTLFQGQPVNISQCGNDGICDLQRFMNLTSFADFNHCNQEQIDDINETSNSDKLHAPNVGTVFAALFMGMLIGGGIALAVATRHHRKVLLKRDFERQDFEPIPKDDSDSSDNGDIPEQQNKKTVKDKSSVV